MRGSDSIGDSSLNQSLLQSSVTKYILTQLAWFVISLWLIVSIIFGLLYFIPDYSAAELAWGAAQAGGADPANGEIAEPTLWEEYSEWMGMLITLDIGDVGYWVVEHSMITLVYLIPATILAFLGAMVCGYLSATKRNSLVDLSLRSSSYLLFAVPNFLAAALIIVYIEQGNLLWLVERRPVPGAFELNQGIYLILPFAFMVTHLFAIQIRYARAESLDYLQATFVKVVKAKGAHPWRVARHVFRTAAVPLFTLFVVEVIGVLLVTIFVLEAVLNVYGIGWYAYEAVMNEMILDVLVITIVFSFVILVANMIQDLAYAALDPRIEL